MRCKQTNKTPNKNKQKTTKKEGDFQGGSFR